MFNYLLGAEYTSYFDFSTTEGTFVCVGLILLAVMIVACVAVRFAKKEYFKYTVLGCVAIAVVYALTVTIINLVGVSKTTDMEDGLAGLVSEGKSYPWIIAVITIVLFGGLVLSLLVDRKQVKGRAHTMSVVYAAVCIALAFGLSYVKFYDAPYGGSITMFSLLPIAFYSYMFGVRRGTMSGFIYGLLQTLQNPWIVHPVQFILDYILPFALVGTFGGLFRKTFNKISLNAVVKDGIALACGIFLGVIARFICHFISGAVYFGEYMPAEFDNVWLYSFVYQCTYVLPDGAISMVGAVLVMTSAYFRKQINGVIANYERYSGKETAAKTDDGNAENNVEA